MKYRIFMTLATIFIIIVFISLLVIFTPRLITGLAARTNIYKPNTAPIKDVAIVFGAGLHRDGTPTPVLKDRVKTAADLYFAGKVKKLLLTGDNIDIGYNEPASMQAYAMELGVPQTDLVLDYAGRRTYDSCYRAKYIFNVKSAALVTQTFHLPRAIFLCQQLNLESVGVNADQRIYTKRSQTIWFIRELPATLMAAIDIWIRHPIPVMGDPEPIILDTNPS